MMKFDIRPYRENDFETIVSWWEAHHEVPPLPGMMIEDGTFVLEMNGEPIITLTAFKTQSKQISFLEGFCSKPGLDKKLRNELSRGLWRHVLNYLKEDGFKRVMIMAHREALAKRYQELGMQMGLHSVQTLGREI